MNMLLAVTVLAAMMAVSAPASALPKGAHPIINARDGWLIGGTVNGKWLDAEAMTPHVKGGETYRIYSLETYLGKATGSKVRVDAPCDTRYVDLSVIPDSIFDTIGISATWEPMPRKTKLLSTKQAVYVQAVGKVLAEEGLSGAKVNITQVVKVDLEGDKQDEVIISATTPREGYPQPDSEKNDYSLVLLRKMVKGKVQTFVLAGDFYAKHVEFNAPEMHQIAAVLDFDGDGKMEIAVSSRYYEGNAITIYGFRDGKVVELVGGGSGA